MVQRLAKPSSTPSPSVISLIWMILYPIILVSFGFVFVQAFRSKMPWRVALPFAKILVANLLFMPIFSGLRNVPLAAADIVIVWATILWCMITVWPVYKWVAAAQVPYLRNENAAGSPRRRTERRDHSFVLASAFWIASRIPIGLIENASRAVLS